MSRGMSKMSNPYYTTDLTWSVMSIVANRIGANIDNKEVMDVIYGICSDLESFPEDCGFGSSDINSYVRRAEENQYLRSINAKIF